MPFNMPRGGDASAPSAYQVPTARSLAVTVIVAVLILWALRHVYGSIQISGGSK